MHGRADCQDGVVSVYDEPHSEVPHDLPRRSRAKSEGHPLFNGCTRTI